MEPDKRININLIDNSNKMKGTNTRKEMRKKEAANTKMDVGADTIFKGAITLNKVLRTLKILSLGGRKEKMIEGKMEEEEGRGRSRWI